MKCENRNSTNPFLIKNIDEYIEYLNKELEKHLNRNPLSIEETLLKSHTICTYSNVVSSLENIKKVYLLKVK